MVRACDRAPGASTTNTHTAPPPKVAHVERRQSLEYGWVIVRYVVDANAAHTQGERAGQLNGATTRWLADVLVQQVVRAPHATHAALERNQMKMTGANTIDTLAVPIDCMKKMPARMTMLMPTTTPAGHGSSGSGPGARPGASPRGALLVTHTSRAPAHRLRCPSASVCPRSQRPQRWRASARRR